MIQGTRFSEPCVSCKQQPARAIQASRHLFFDCLAQQKADPKCCCLLSQRSSSNFACGCVEEKRRGKVLLNSMVYVCLSVESELAQEQKRNRPIGRQPSCLQHAKRQSRPGKVHPSPPEPGSLLCRHSPKTHHGRPSKKPSLKAMFVIDVGILKKRKGETCSSRFVLGPPLNILFPGPQLRRLHSKPP